MVFSKSLMLDRVEREGLTQFLNEETIAIMDNLDGQECDEQCWARVVNGEPVYYVIGKDGTGHYVNERDCI